MLDTLPKTVDQIQNWQWSDIAPYLNQLQETVLTENNISQWLVAWTQLNKLVLGRLTHLRLACDKNTADTELERQRDDMLAHIIPPYRTAENKLTEKLLQSGYEPEGMHLVLKKMRTAYEIFREENLPLQVQEQKLQSEYSKIKGAQTVTWDAEEMTVTQLNPFLQSSDRAVREKAWRAGIERQLQDREPLNKLWTQLLELRIKMAQNAGFESYRDLRWKQFNRFDYSPQDCETFHRAIEEVVVPLHQKIQTRRKEQLGVDTLRPWDNEVDPLNRAPLRPFKDVKDLESIAEAMFYKVDPQLGKYYTTMRQQQLLDLDNRKNKAPGGYCTSLPIGEEMRPFIFMNSVGMPRDVTTLLHEAGHAFHVFEASKLPYAQQRHSGAEFAEVASMSMELLAYPFLTREEGGYFDESDAARYQIEHLEQIIGFLPYMAVVDAFQHWVYTNAEAAKDSANCDTKWGELWNRFLPDEDWSDLEDARVTGWHRKLHIYQYPFYYVDYGLARLGSLQVWAKAIEDPERAVQDYIKSLQLGGTASLPELYDTAGAKFAFDTQTVGEVITLVERTLAGLYTKE
jgi:oligoendopeptidase F